MDPVQNQIVHYATLLAQIAGPTFEWINKYDPYQLPYRWEFRTRIEPIQYVATIELTTDDVLGMNGMSDDQKREYLRKRFGHLFSKRP